MVNPHKRKFVSIPSQMGSVINELIGGAHLPVCWLDKSGSPKWKEPVGYIEDGQYGNLSIVIDFSMTPHEERESALVVDVQMRVRDLWPNLDVEVVYEGGLVGYYAKLINHKATSDVGTAPKQASYGRYGDSYYTGPDGKPRRLSYNTDVSKFVIAGLKRQAFVLVHENGQRLTPEELKGDNNPKDTAWVIIDEGDQPTISGVQYSDLTAAARLTNNLVVVQDDGVVTVI